VILVLYQPELVSVKRLPCNPWKDNITIALLLALAHAHKTWSVVLSHHKHVQFLSLEIRNISTMFPWGLECVTQLPTLLYKTLFQDLLIKGPFQTASWVPLNFHNLICGELEIGTWGSTLHPKSQVPHHSKMATWQHFFESLSTKEARLGIQNGNPT